jgi:hypothetical protein
VKFFFRRQPIPDGDNSLGVSWPPVDDSQMNFVDFNLKLSLNTTFYPDRVAFWNGIEDILTTGSGTLKDGPVKPSEDSTETKDEL